MQGELMSDREKTEVNVMESRELAAIDHLPVGYLEMDTEGVIRRANAMTCRLFQKDREAIVGRTPWEFMAADEIKMSQEAFFEVMRTGAEAPPIRRTFYNERGEFRKYEMHRTVMMGPEGKPAGLRYAFVDITEATIAHEEAHATRQFLESILGSVDEAMIVTDTLGFIRFSNAAAEELTGWKAEELQGALFEKRLPLLSYQPSDGGVYNHRIVLERRCRGVAKMLGAGRCELSVELSTSPIIDKNEGVTLGVVRILRQASACECAPQPA